MVWSIRSLSSVIELLLMLLLLTLTNNNSFFFQNYTNPDDHTLLKEICYYFEHCFIKPKDSDSDIDCINVNRTSQNNTECSSFV